MADCSATGNALDRVITETITSSAHATGALKQMVGNVALASSAATGPMMAGPSHMAPDIITLPGGHRGLFQQQTPSMTGTNTAVVSQQEQPHASVTSNLIMQQQHLVSGPQYVPPAMQMPLNYHPMQAQAQMYQMQAQMQAMSLQQQMMQQQQQQRYQAEQNKKQQSVHMGNEQVQSVDERVESTLPVEDTWHLGLEDEWEKTDNLPEGTSIDQLAQAWAEAEQAWAEEEKQEAMKYDFQEESRNLKTNDPMSEGISYFKSGDTGQAIICFESELLNHPDNSDAWKMLGRCHAENDEDRKAIACFERAVEMDPYNLEARLALGVSYVNELNNEKALINLKAWVQHNPDYADLQVLDDGYGDGTVLDDVQNLMLQALQIKSKDPDVLEALGVCYNASRDYESAVRCFKDALEVRPNDYQLWNKLGATLANGQKSVEALPAYKKALDFKPKYARAWLNMAISHSNLQNYEDASRCYLQTLSLNPAAVHCWSYLRISLTCTEQWDLLPLLGAQDINAFREYFDFV
mmetsp:Transcript_731/g.945  ORF Transcript_731/g.945 Transcript_731/m.945 type:complete len:522 (-) Transcript_731:137-1702(-)